jgi:hypothetical protein
MQSSPKEVDLPDSLFLTEWIFLWVPLLQRKGILLPSKVRSQTYPTRLPQAGKQPFAIAIPWTWG